MRLLLTSSTRFCWNFRVWPYFFILSIGRLATSTSSCKGFLENVKNSSCTVSCVDGSCELSGDALRAFVGVKLSAVLK